MGALPIVPLLGVGTAAYVYEQQRQAASQQEDMMRAQMEQQRKLAEQQMEQQMELAEQRKGAMETRDERAGARARAMAGAWDRDRRRGYVGTWLRKRGLGSEDLLGGGSPFGGSSLGGGGM